MQPSWWWDLAGRAVRPGTGARCFQQPRSKSWPRGGKAIQGWPRAVHVRAELSCLGVAGRGETQLPVGACRLQWGREAPRSAFVCWRGPAEKSCSCLKQTGARPRPLWPAGRPAAQTDPPSPFYHTEVTVLSLYWWEKAKYPYIRTLAYAFNDSSESEKTLQHFSLDDWGSRFCDTEHWVVSAAGENLGWGLGEEHGSGKSNSKYILIYPLKTFLCLGNVFLTPRNPIVNVVALDWISQVFEVKGWFMIMHL